MSVNVLPLQQPVEGGELLDRSLLLFRVSLVRCLPLSLVAVTLGQLPTLWLDLAGRGVGAAKPPGWWLLVAGSGVLNLLLWSVLLLRQQAIACGAPPRTGAEFSAALRNLPQILGVLLLAAVLVAAGLVVLLLPGIYLIFALWFACPVRLFEGASVLRSLDRSLQLVRGNWVRTAGLCATGLIAAIVFYSLAYVLGLVAAAMVGEARSQPFSVIVGPLVGALFMPFITALTLTQYADLTLRARRA